MPLAVIRFRQASLPLVPPGTARRDIAKSVPVILSNNDDAGVTSWRWTLLAKPPGSTATIINPTSAVANLTPDMDGGTYRVQLAINQGRASHGEAQIRVFRVPDASGFAAPAAGEKGSEANYIVGGNPNTIAWADEMLRRYLYQWNNRAAPFAATIAAGDDQVFEIPWTLPDAMLQYLRIQAGTGTDLDVGFYSDAALTKLTFELLNIDATDPGGYKLIDHKTLTYDDPPTRWEDDKIYLKLHNSDAVDCDVRVFLRIGAV